MRAVKIWEVSLWGEIRKWGRMLDDEPEMAVDEMIESLNDSPFHHGKVFRNFWHAWAYAQKIKQGVSNEQ